MNSEIINDWLEMDELREKVLSKKKPFCFYTDIRIGIGLVTIFILFLIFG